MHVNLARESDLPQAIRNGLLLTVLTLTLIVRLPLMLNVHTVEYDEAIFLDVARNIQRVGLPIRSIGAQGSFFFDHTFLYVYLLSLSVPTSDVGIFMTRMLTIVLSLGCIWLTFGCAEQLRGPRAGFVAALLLALNPFFSVYSFFIRMEIPITFALLTAFRFFLHYLKTEHRRWIVFTGIAVAIAVLLKEIALLFAGTLVLQFLTDANIQKRRALKNAILVSIPTAIGMISWSAWCFAMSPTIFLKTLERWLDSAAIGRSSDFRMLITPLQWTQQITCDLLSIPLVLGTMGALSIALFKRRKLSPASTFLTRYIIVAIGLSYIMKLKELRYLIAVIPATALLVGVSLNWQDILTHRYRISRQIRVISLVSLLLMAGGSPLRLPSRASTAQHSWLAPIYTQRFLANEPYYNALRLTGIYLKDHSASTSIIAVVHEAPVIGYYADRRYIMLYTQNSETAVIETLAQTQDLVWDHTVFPTLEEEQIRVIQDYVAQHFTVAQIIRDDYREITIYHRSEAASPY